MRAESARLPYCWATEVWHHDLPAVRECPSWPGGSTPPQTGRIYDRTRSDENTVSDRSLDIREESIYALLGEMADTIGVQRLSFCAIGVMSATIIAFAQPNGGGPGPVLGIVEIPEMFFVDPNTGRYAPRAALTLYTRPDSDSKVAAVISTPEAIDGAGGRVPRIGSAHLRS